jgi:hypothetical protein
LFYHRDADWRMTIYILGNQSEGFIGLRSADPNDSGYEAAMMIRHEPASVRARWKHPPVEFNLSRLRRIALNLLKRDTSVKIGIAGQRLKAGWDEHFLLRLLTS